MNKPSLSTSLNQVAVPLASADVSPVIADAVSTPEEASGEDTSEKVSSLMGRIYQGYFGYLILQKDYYLKHQFYTTSTIRPQSDQKSFLISLLNQSL